MAESVKIGRNEPCPCGSGKKYKRCCLTNDLLAVLESIKPANAMVDSDKLEYEDITPDWESDHSNDPWHQCCDAFDESETLDKKSRSFGKAPPRIFLILKWLST